MLDIKFIRENAELVEKESKAKHFPVDIKALLSLDDALRPLKQEQESWQAERNRLSKEIPKSSAEDREVLKQKVHGLKAQIDGHDQKIDDLTKKIEEIMLRVAQPAREDVPEGKDDSCNVEIKKWGNVPQFSFPPKSHIEIGEMRKLIDFARGVKLSGSRSYILCGDGALLERALMNFTYDRLLSKGFRPMSVPVLVSEAAMQGTGYFPNGRDQAYCVEKDELALVGTSEVSLCGMFADETFAAGDLPLRLMAQTACFRREAGTYGKDTKGLYRVHQFQKIEMVVFAPTGAAASEKLHDELLQNAESLLQELGLAYRVVYVCKGDLGQGQVRKHDVETWMPSRNNYGETNSCSSFYDFQARRLGIRYKDENGQRHFAYTLNNTALAAPRLILAILENFQTKDGRVEIPKCLRPYMGGKEFI